MKIVEYSEKCIAVVGDDTRKHKEELKAIGGRFNPYLSCGAGWVFKVAHRAEVERVVNGESTSVPATSESNDLKLAYRDEYIKAHGERFADYALKECSMVIELAGGKLVPFKKPTIRTEFCFGYGAQGTSKTSAEAWKRADEAKTESYFMSENLQRFETLLHRIKVMESEGLSLYIHQSNFYKEKGANIWYYAFLERGCFNPASACYNNYNLNYPNRIELSNDDVAKFKGAVIIEKNKFEKRLKSYIKRYGTSKIKTWAYWADE